MLVVEEPELALRVSPFFVRVSVPVDVSSASSSTKSSMFAVVARFLKLRIVVVHLVLRICFTVARIKLKKAVTSCAQIPSSFKKPRYLGTHLRICRGRLVLFTEVRPAV